MAPAGTAGALPSCFSASSSAIGSCRNVATDRFDQCWGRLSRSTQQSAPYPHQTKLLRGESRFVCNPSRKWNMVWQERFPPARLSLKVVTAIPRLYAVDDKLQHSPHGWVGGAQARAAASAAAPCPAAAMCDPPAAMRSRSTAALGLHPAAQSHSLASGWQFATKHTAPSSAKHQRQQWLQKRRCYCPPLSDSRIASRPSSRSPTTEEGLWARDTVHLQRWPQPGARLPPPPG